MIRLGIIGAGLIGGKRARAVQALSARAKVTHIQDQVLDRAAALASEVGGTAVKSASEILNDPGIDAVIIATANGSIPEFSVSALKNGKHVLAEKPAGRTPSEIKIQIDAATNARKILAIGFNHRFHPGFLEAKKIMMSGQYGKLMYIRARYGHGARVGYEKEWRADPKLSGGGELLDQGVHLIDLCRFLGGEFELEWGKVESFFWKMPVEDNGFLYLRSPSSPARAFLHASCTEWKNLFDFEIFSETAKIEIAGLGRSYGTEELKLYKMKPEMGPPDFETKSFPGEDDSWVLETGAFLDEIEGKKTQIAKGIDALRALEIVDGAYRKSNVEWLKN